MVKKAKLHFENNPVSLALAALLLGGICIGTSPIFVRLSEVGPVSSAFWRMFLVLPLFYLTMNLKKNPNKEKKPLSNKKFALGVFLCGFMFAADLAVWHWSLLFTTVANATLLPNLMPIVVAFGAYFIFKERLTKVFYLGMVLALLGAILLTGGGVGEGRLLGDGLALLTAVFYGGFILSVRWLRQYKDTSLIMFLTSLVSIVFLFPIAFFTGEVILPPSINGWVILIGLAFISQFLGQGLITYSLVLLPPSFGAISLLVQPVVAAAIAWPLFGESLNSKDLIAIGVILSGIVLARVASIKQPVKQLI